MNYDNQDNGNSKKIINKIASFDFPKSKNKDKTYSIQAFLDFSFFHFKNFLIYLLALLSFILVFLKPKYRRFRGRYAIGKKKWPHLSEFQLIKVFKDVSLNNNSFNNLTIKKHYSGFFKINKINDR